MSFSLHLPAFREREKNNITVGRGLSLTDSCGLVIHSPLLAGERSITESYSWIHLMGAFLISSQAEQIKVKRKRKSQHLKDELGKSIQAFQLLQSQNKAQWTPEDSGSYTCLKMELIQREGRQRQGTSNENQKSFLSLIFLKAISSDWSCGDSQSFVSEVQILRALARRQQTRSFPWLPKGN